MFIRALRLVGYVRTGHTDVSKDDQIAALKAYCEQHGHKLRAIYSDENEPGVGFTDALDVLHEVDGLITYDATRLVKHPSDTFRELRPLFKNKFMLAGKKILTVVDGIENVTPTGQHNIMELMSTWSRREEMTGPTMDVELNLGSQDSYATNT